MLVDAKRSRVELPDRGVALALLDWGGDGPPALLAHANGFCAALWDPIARLLRERFHVIGYDQRGHGDSSAPPLQSGYAWTEFTADLIAVAERIGEPAYAIGHSFGGTAALHAAAARPDLFARIAMLDPVLVPPDVERSVERYTHKSQMSARARRRRVVWRSREAAREAWQGRDAFAGWDPRAFELYLAEALRDRPDGRVELKCTGEVEASIYSMSAHGADIYASASALRVPGLLLHAVGGNFPRAVFERIDALAARVTLEDVEGTHLFPMQQPERVARRLIDWRPWVDRSGRSETARSAG